MRRSFKDRNIHRLPLGVIERVAPVQPARRALQFYARMIVGSLLAANLVAALVLFGPWSDQVAALEAQLAAVQAQIRQTQQSLNELQEMTVRIEQARDEGDQFIDRYFLDRRTAYSQILTEINAAAERSGLTPREHSFTFEAIEGSDYLDVLTIVANYQGSYDALLKFLNWIDRSDKLLILDALQAVPTQDQARLNINARLYVFVKEERTSS